ncbi:uncharacterized protein LOC121412140 [Lytechinus variegatus]|uniref:uncharacterized protein LOC121412140 n=1 Tax=Lytechinus variegatus TaxID=7654 RepID=UPI001BB20A36|nr:uncharacterized protein LOC121412140 [Lytechinus variegatus]
MQNVNECLAEFYEDFWPKYREYKVALKDSSAVWGLLTRHTHELGEPIRRFKQLGLEAQKYLKSHDIKLTEGRVSNLTQQKPRGGDQKPEMFQNMLQTGSDDRRDKLKNVNDEMVEDLNQLFQQRGGFVIDIFKSVYTAHNDFYSESSKISGTILDMVIDLENVRLEMSVGQGKHRRVASTNKPRIGWAKTTPTPAPQPAHQPPPPSSASQGPAASFIPPPPTIGVSKQRGGRPKPDAQDIARPISVATPGRERNPTEFSRGNEMPKAVSGNKGKPMGRSKQEVQDIARPTNVGEPTGLNEMVATSANKGMPKPLVGRSKQEVQDIARPTAVESRG